jgi:hypothetical protein
MRKSFFACVLGALVLLLSQPAAAQGSGELWEITMNVPGMPAGMMPPQRVCQGDDPERAAQQQGGGKQDCKVVDRKQSGSRTTVTMKCADGSTMTIDQQFNAARTEFKSTMKSSGGRDGDMTMAVSGRKVGACDAVAERKDRDKKMSDMKKQVEAGQAQSAAAMKQSSDTQIKDCNAALESMEFRKLGIYGHCYKGGDRDCASTMKSMSETQPEAAKVCTAKVAEYCKRFQTADGFLKARGDESIAKSCGVTTASIKAAQCPRAAQNESLAFLGAYCPVQAAPIAREHCVGRDYTSKMGGKYGAFCQSYLANADFEERNRIRPGSAAAPSQPRSTSDHVKDGMTKGLDKLKGLFGR